MRVIGIDLAWRPDKNSSAIAVCKLQDKELHLEQLITSVIGINNILHIIKNEQQVQGISIDAPLIINNPNGQRQCEADLNRVYRKVKAGCHPSNLSLYPNAGSVYLSKALAKLEFKHLGRDAKSRWQIECYPHPALVELFDLENRLLYKKGRVMEKKKGQIQLATLLRSLEKSRTLKLYMGAEAEQILSEQQILSNKGKDIKQNEDALDAIICAYIGACYANKLSHRLFGDAKDGYIYVPTSQCS